MRGTLKRRSQFDESGNGKCQEDGQGKGNEDGAAEIKGGKR